MKIYGNLHNRIMESCKPTTPEIGMGATLCFYSDREAGTIIEMKSPNELNDEQKATVWKYLDKHSRGSWLRYPSSQVMQALGPAGRR